MKDFMKRASVCVMLLFAFFSLGCTAQIKGTFKLVTKLSDLSNTRRYAIVAVVDGQMYAMQAKDDANSSSKRLCVENITADPSLFGDDNIFKFGKPSDKGSYYTCPSFSAINGSNVYHEDLGNAMSVKYGGKLTKKDFYFFLRDGYEGVIMGTSSSCPINVAHSDAYKVYYCKGYSSLAGENTMRVYEYDENATSDMQVGSVEIKTAEGYATYYNSKSFVVPSGLTAAIVKEADRSSGELTLDWKFEAGDVVPGATALLIHGEKGTYLLNAPAAGAASPNPQVSTLSVDVENLLRGSDEDSETTGVEDGVPYFYYKLSYLVGVEGGEKVLGFYWGATSGAAFTNKANHAYLALKQNASFDVKGFHLPAFSDVTGISYSCAPNDGKVIMSDRRQGIFSLEGVEFPVDDVQSLPSGIYIVNGHKYLKK